MALELVPVEPHAIFLAMNYMCDLLLHFASYWTGNRVWDLVISYQHYMICMKFSNKKLMRKTVKGFWQLS